MIKPVILGVALTVTLSACSSSTASVDAVQNLQPYPSLYEETLGEIMAGRQFCDGGRWSENELDNGTVQVEYRCTLVNGAAVLNDLHSPDDPFAKLEDVIVWDVREDDIEINDITLLVTQDSGEVREITSPLPRALLIDILEEHLEPGRTDSVRDVIVTRSRSLYFRG